MTIIADTKTPIQLFQLFQDRASFILESNDSLSPWSNYSFIGLDPKYFFLEKDGKFSLINHVGKTIIENEDLFYAWDECLQYFAVSPIWPDVPFPGGAVGYFSFEAYALQETSISFEKKMVPDVHLVFCETILAFHHEKEELTIIHLQKVNDDWKESYQIGQEKIMSIVSALESKKISSEVSVQPKTTYSDEDIFSSVTTNVEKEQFLRHIRKIKSSIKLGEVSQVVVSQTFKRSFNASGFEVYRVLRKTNPSPYLYYLRLSDMELIGSSPERQMKIDSFGLLEIHPIAGTRPRGNTKEEDETFKKELLRDEKELLEHDMLVELAKDDLRKISEKESIFVSEQKSVVYFSHVMHLMTKVYGKLKKGCHPFHAFLTAHPAGTVSGYPKKRAIEIIKKIEAEPRGVYAGSIAYCGFNSAIDSCIAIRTIILKNGIASVQAGAGIVKDSDPEKEYDETKNKARGLLYALKIAEKRKNDANIKINKKI